MQNLPINIGISMKICKKLPVIVQKMYKTLYKVFFLIYVYD